MAPKGRARKKVPVIEANNGTFTVENAKDTETKIDEVIDVPMKVRNKKTQVTDTVNGIEQPDQTQEKKVTGRGRLRAKATESKAAGESSSELNSHVPRESKAVSKRGKKAVKPDDDGENILEVEKADSAEPKDVPVKRGRKPASHNTAETENNGSGGVPSVAVAEDPSEPQVEENSDVKTNVELKTLPGKRGKKQAEHKTAKIEKDAEAKNLAECLGEDDNPKIEAESEVLPTKRGRKQPERKPAKTETDVPCGDSAEVQEDSKEDMPAKGGKKKLKNENTNMANDKDPVVREKRTRGVKKAPSEETASAEEASVMPDGQKRKNEGKMGNKKTKKGKVEECSPEIDENRQLRVALKRNRSLDEMAESQFPNAAETVEQSKVKTAKGPSKAKGKRGPVNEDASQPAKKAKEAEPSKSKGAAKKDKIPDVTTLNFDNESKTADGKAWNLKLASWNVNGIRAWLEKNGMSYLHHEKPDILCIQETKCSKEKLPTELNVEGYHCYWLSGDKDGYSGVGLMSKEKPVSLQNGIGIEEHDNEGRVITAEYENFYLVTTYVPNAGRGLIRLDYRQKWDKDFRDYLKKLDEKKPVVLCGDLNVAHEEIDIANPKSNKKNAGFTKEEREGFSTLLSEGFIDTFRHLYPDTKGAYTFWTYMMNARAKNVGWRLDYFVISKRFVDHLCDSVIRKEVLGSDHCPIGLLLHV